MGRRWGSAAEQGGGGTVPCVHCLLIKNPCFSTLCQGRGSSHVCEAESWLVGSRVGGMGPRALPEEGNTVGISKQLEITQEI